MKIVWTILYYIGLATACFLTASMGYMNGTLFQAVGLIALSLFVFIYALVKGMRCIALKKHDAAVTAQNDRLQSFIDENKEKYEENSEVIRIYDARIECFQQTIDSLNGKIAQDEKMLQSYETLAQALVSSMDNATYKHYVGIKLTQRGWHDLDYSPKGGSSGADILGVTKEGKRACVLCKPYIGTASVDSVRQIYSAKTYYGCEEAYVCCANGYNPNSTDYAEKLGVALWMVK